MPDTMIDRLTVELADALRYDAPGLSSETCREAVKRLIEKMREPSAAMEKAGLDAAGGDGSCLASYEAMIDAALAEG
jgi:hypothetical protein